MDAEIGSYLKKCRFAAEQRRIVAEWLQMPMDSSCGRELDGHRKKLKKCHGELKT